MKVIDAELLPDGSRRFIIEVVPATLDGKGKETAAAQTETFIWGADVVLADARRETKLLLAAKYGQVTPTKIAAMIGKEI